MVYFVTGCFIVMDMVTGIIKALKNKEFTSSIMREGLFHKVGSILCMVFGVLVDYAQTLVDLGVTIPVASAVCVYICMMEIGSIIENVSMINPEIVPEKLTVYFSKLTNKSEGDKVE